MKIRNYITALALLICSAGLHAQDHTSYNLYMQNPVLYNPSYTFDSYKFNAYVNSQNQWSGFTGAPETVSFGFHGKLADNMGLGFLGYRNTQGLNTQTNVNISYAYRAAFADDHYLGFGLNLGSFFEGLDRTKIENSDMSDMWLVENGNKTATFAARFGLQYHIKGFEIGIAMPQLYQKSELALHTVSVLSYNYEINENIAVKPSAIVRYAKFSDLQYGVNVSATWRNMIQIQAGYSSEKSIVAAVGVMWTEYALAYAYGHNFGDFSDIFSTTHEIQFAYRLPFNKDKTDKQVAPLCCFGNGGTVVKVEEPIVVKETFDFNSSVKATGYGFGIEAMVKIMQDTAVVTASRTNGKGQQNTEIKPGVYTVEYSSPGYIPVVQELDLSGVSVGEAYKSEVQLQRLEAGYVFNTGIQFESGSDRVKAESFKKLDMLVQFFKDTPNLEVEISGHTDNVGSAESNLILSKKRAQVVADYLISKGVNPKQLKVTGFGADKPIADNATDDGKAQNRRIEMNVINPPKL